MLCFIEVERFFKSIFLVLKAFPIKFSHKVDETSAEENRESLNKFIYVNNRKGGLRSLKECIGFQGQQNIYIAKKVAEHIIPYRQSFIKKALTFFELGYKNSAQKK